MGDNHKLDVNRYHNSMKENFGPQVLEQIWPMVEKMFAQDDSVMEILGVDSKGLETTYWQKN